MTIKKYVDEPTRLISKAVHRGGVIEELLQALEALKSGITVENRCSDIEELR